MPGFDFPCRTGTDKENEKNSEYNSISDLPDDDAGQGLSCQGIPAEYRHYPYGNAVCNN